MPASFNHTIIAAVDREESARFYRELLEVPAAESWGIFANIQLEGGVLMQFAEPPVDIQMQHYAFLVDDAHFDRAYARLRGTISLTVYPAVSFSSFQRPGIGR
ncbi:VOC family protein [Zafaria sp. J156]|uniref:VOC family protein n=1 Tax=Zafaria sp. J156 TaxID=3116490 RepID=UPI002E75F67F|nr:VOC family protein [Zafaria sp. J156]MEE1623001.1 VOC family protein [Zafaria sp. J156]